MPVILINLNIPPTERYKVSNIMACMAIPGPGEPKNWDSFVFPLIQELRKLRGDQETGNIQAIDGDCKQNFNLRAYVTVVTGKFNPLYSITNLIHTGDGPAAAIAMGLKKPGNAFRPCRSCMVQGLRQQNGKTYYVPNKAYLRGNVKLRDDIDLSVRDLIDLFTSPDIEGDSRIHDARKRIGIERRSILLQVPSIHFTRSFSIDLMHCILLNVLPLLFNIWHRSSKVEDSNSTWSGSKTIEGFNIPATGGYECN